MNKVQHVKVTDQALDSELRRIIATLNELVDKSIDPASSPAKDTSKQGVQGLKLQGNLFTVAVLTPDGFVNVLPGLFQKITPADTKVASAGQILVAQGDGNYLPRSIIGGKGSSVSGSGGDFVISGTGLLGRCKTEALIAGVPKTCTYSSELTGTIHVKALSCYDSTGYEVECAISAVTSLNFIATCPVNATLIYLVLQEL